MYKPIRIQRIVAEGVWSDLRSVEELYAQGHPNILAKHPTTFEVTKDKALTLRGDCVIGVNANKGPRDFSNQFIDLCRQDESRIQIQFQADGIVDFIEGRGSRKLTFKHSSESVGRRSSFASSRTIMVKADRAARDLNRELIDALTRSETKLWVRITVEF
jgi:hypothetical protein